MTSMSKPGEEIVAESAPGGASDFNTKMIEEFRANEGRVGGPWADTTLILIHHIGARSGTERVTPLGCSPQGDGRFAIVASNGGSPAHPDWYYNLKSNPRIKVEVGTQTFTVLAEELDDTVRAGLWPKLVAEYPSIGKYQARTARQIPVFMLTRVTAQITSAQADRPGRRMAVSLSALAGMPLPGSSACRWGRRTRTWPRPTAR
jgi:deazaflavin-dependent oxidoreductase (nitroreductase family)